MTFGPLVSAEWLADHLDDEDLAIIDVRWSVADGPKRADYEAGHIPGARFADLDVDLSAPPSPETGRHPLPAPIAFAASIGRLGVGDITRAVVYDDAGGMIAARLWWMLDIIGRDVAVLDGGVQAWTGKLSKAKVKAADTTFTPRPWPDDRRIAIDALASLLDESVVLDARSEERYAGGAEIDPRPGHIPGARSAPASDNLDGEGLWKSPRRLRYLYEELGADGENVVAYCGSGVTACADLLGRRLAGMPDGRLFVGSWSMWGADESLPAEVG